MVCCTLPVTKWIGLNPDFLWSGVKLAVWFPALLLAITCVSNVQMSTASPFKTSKFQEPQAIEFWPSKSLSEVSEVFRDSIFQSGSCFGNVRVHSSYSLTLSNTPGCMWCDSQASSWPAPLWPLCLDSRASSCLDSQASFWPATF